MKTEETSINPRVAWEGCSVLLDINDGDRLVFARLNSNATLKIGDKKCFLRSLIGCPFGSTFQVESTPNGPSLNRINVSTENTQSEMADSKDECDQKDNRSLLDNNTAQGLSGEDIDILRRKGASGDQIIEALIANSATFENKTIFSQEKYKRRKQKKYAPRVLMRRPFARSICEGYFRKYPARIGFLRMDALSILLSLANICAYSNVLVVDMVGGILTGAVAERLGGTGYVCNTYFGAAPYSIDIVRLFNFNEETCSRILQSPLSDLRNNLLEQSDIYNVESKEGQSSNVDTNNLPTNCTSSCELMVESKQESTPENQISPDLYQEALETNGTSSSGHDTIESAPMRPCPTNGGIQSDAYSAKGCKPANPGRRASLEMIQMWRENGFSSLIIAASEGDPWSTIQELLPLLSYSAPFAIYHQYLQPLSICMHNLQQQKKAINLQIFEPWLREYQVLPSRTHPQMQMSAFGGYILSGIRVCNN